MNGKIIGSVKVQIGGCLFTFYRLSYDKMRDVVPEKKEVTLHCHLYYEIMLVTEGKCAFYFRDETVTLKSGEMIIIEPETYHYGYDGFEINTGAHVQTLALTVEQLDAADGICQHFKSLFHMNADRAIPVTEELCERVKLFNAMQGSSLCALCEEKMNISRIIYLLSESFGDSAFERKHSPDIADPKDMQVLLDCMINIPTIKLEQIAEKLNYSPKQVSRLISRTYGMSLKQIQSKRRMETAIMLMTGPGDLSIKEISDKSGYATLGNFYRCFREETGMAPDAFRQIFRRGENGRKKEN